MAAPPIVQPVDVDPDALLALHATRPDLYPALLQSAAIGEPLGRYDILFAHPRGRLILRPDGALREPDGRIHPGDFLRALDAWRDREAASSLAGCLPFRGGWLLYLGYELASQIEPRLRLPMPDAGPVAAAIRVPCAVIYEHDSRQAWIVAESGADSSLDLIRSHIASTPRFKAAGDLTEGAVSEESPERFLDAVARALDYIAAGDIYQANLSRAWRARLRDGASAANVYQRLRATNPGPFSGVAQLDDFAIISSSPERLVEVRGCNVSTRPIAGTRPRGSDAQADRSLAQELHAHPKERAEHVMLIDLERNDLGRVCEAGTVRVDEYMSIESYAHVHHIVSNVSGVLRTDATTGDVLRAVFPGGTITGCPKIRCMEIIAELERAARGPYTGALGYLNLNGDMDLNILIRTIGLHGREVTIRAGAGVVADSIAERELAETRAKARGVLRALAAGVDA